MTWIIWGSDLRAFIFFFSSLHVYVKFYSIAASVCIFVGFYPDEMKMSQHALLYLWVHSCNCVHIFLVGMIHIFEFFIRSNRREFTPQSFNGGKIKVQRAPDWNKESLLTGQQVIISSLCSMLSPLIVCVRAHDHEMHPYCSLISPQCVGGTQVSPVDHSPTDKMPFQRRELASSIVPPASINSLSIYYDPTGWSSWLKLIVKP